MKKTQFEELKELLDLYSDRFDCIEARIESTNQRFDENDSKSLDKMVDIAHKLNQFNAAPHAEAIRIEQNKLKGAMEDIIEKLNENCLRVNNMMLELKGMLSIVRPLAHRRENGPPQVEKKEEQRVVVRKGWAWLKKKFA